MTSIRTMQDLLENLETLGYAQSTINQIRPRIKECERIYNEPLERIPVDPAAFEERWGRGRVGAIAAGFESQAKFIDWRKRVGGVLNKLAGPKPSTPLLPDWERLCDYLRKNGGVGRPLGPHRHYGVEKVGGIASRDGLRPRDLAGHWVHTAAEPLKGAIRRTFKGGLVTLNDLVRDQELYPEIASLLPPEPLPQPGRVKAVPSPWRRGCRPQAARLWREFDAFVAAKRGTDALGRPIPAEESDFRKRTAETYENAVNLATSLLDRSGDLDASMTPGLSDICNPEAIARVANLWQTRCLEGEVRKDAATRLNMVLRLSHIAEAHVGLKKTQKKALNKLKKQVRKTSPKRDAMSPPRLEWIKAFSKSPAQQRAVHTMQEKLMSEANRILDRWEDLKGQKKQKLRMRALSLGIAAVQSAILFRGSAIRASNLRHLTFRGPEAQLFFDTNGDDVRMSIPATLVKNRVDIDAEFDPDARHVIAWYLERVRPKLLGDHPYGCKLVDSDYLFPSMEADRPIEETAFAGHYRRGVRAVGLDMTLHQARHVTGYFILSVDPSAIALVAAVLNDSVEVVEAHYAWMDGVKAGREARKLLQQARRNAAKHRLGSQASAR